MDRTTWGELDALVGVPVVFAAVPGRSGTVVTKAAWVRQQRLGGVLRDHASRVVESLTRVGVSVAGVDGADGLVALRVDRDCWWDTWTSSGTSSMAACTSKLRRDQPMTVQAGQRFAWVDAATMCGTDALVWAALGSASKTAPLTLGQPVEILSSRTDLNPVALVRRAHARAVASSGRPDESRCESGDVADHDLRVALLLASRAAHDADAARRTGPAVLAVQQVATDLLRHVERTPEERTDVPAVRASRKVMSEALGAAGIAAPVPY